MVTAKYFPMGVHVIQSFWRWLNRRRTNDTPAIFDRSDGRLMQKSAAQSAAATSSEHASGVAGEQDRLEKLMTLSRLIPGIRAFTRVEELFCQITQLARDALKFPIVTLWLMEGDGLILRSVSGADGRVPPAGWELVPQQVVAAGRPITLFGQAQGSGAVRSLKITSAMAVPLTWGARLSGVLAVYSPRCNAFQHNDLALLEILGAQISMAVYRIELVESPQQQE